MKNKLTAAMIEVLKDASRHSKGRVGVHAWRQGHGLGKKDSSGGQRRLAAILKLVDLGFLDNLVHDSHSDRPSLGFRTIHSHEAAATITAAGRAALAELEVKNPVPPA